MKKAFLLILLAACLVLTACSTPNAPAPQPSNPESPPPQTSTPESTSPQTPVSDVDSDYEYVKDKEVLLIGYTVYEPMNYTDNDGKFTGFDTELAEIICEKLGVTPGFVEIDWSTKEIELNAKSIDCIWNGLTITPERQETMSITIPYIKNAQVVVMKSDADYGDVSSLADKTVCAESGSAGEEVILDLLKDTEMLFVSKEVQTSCLMEVAAGTADAAILDLTLAKAMTGDGTDYSNLVIKDRLGVEDYGVAFRKGSDLCDKVNDIFRELAADGTLGALADKYGLDIN